MRPALLLAAVTVLAACGSEPDTDLAGRAADAREAASYDGDLDPCSLLSPALAADAIGLTEAEIEPNAYTLENVSEVCVYDAVEGSDGVRLQIVAVAESVAEAEARFAQFRALTDDELAQTAATADQAVDDLEAEGSIDAATAGAVDEVGAGDLIAGMAAAVGYERLDGLGDEAVVETFRGRFNRVVVRDGALIFGASTSTADSPDEMDQDREPSLALARAVLDAR